jgi:peptidoglycan hydrolase-like protein with peptidoglycan-binding domain
MAKDSNWVGAGALGLALLLSTASIAQDYGMPAEPSPVSAVQEQLNLLGYEAGPNDGLMGPKTRSAIRAFQKDAGLPVTGKIDSELLARLQSSSGPAQAIEDPETVLRVENKLDSLGWAVGAIDGKIDDQMRIALTKYTRFADLPVNENLTMATVVHVDRHMLRNVAESASKLLWQVETDLAERGYDVGPIDGTTDQYTFRAILDYEEDNGLPRNGQLNPILLDSLEIADTRPVTDLDLREIERRLLVQGYAPGAADGVLDAQTEAAIKEYQTDAGQAPTGRPTMILLSDLGRSDTLSNSFIAQHGELYPGRRTD